MKTILAILISSACMIIAGCMSQETATRQMTHEFIAELPNHPKTEVYDRVVKWVANSFKSAPDANQHQNRDAGLIVRNGKTEIKPEGSWVKLPVGFTMNVDVRNGRMRVRFTDLRRLYGSKKFAEPLTDDFFRTQTAIPYQQAAHLQFSAIVQSLTEFIEQGKLAAKDVYTPLSSR